MLRIDPRPFSLRELFWMVEAAQIDAWNHTAALLAMQANTAFGKKGRKTVTPKDMHPFARYAPKRKQTKAELAMKLNAMVGLREKPPCHPQQD